MQRIPHASRARRQQLSNGALVILCALIVAALGFAVSQGQAARAAAVDKAADYTPATTYTPPPAPTEVAFLGDSFTVGTGSEWRHKRWTSRLSQEMGWIELNYGYGGTNYATAGTLQGGRAYADRLTDLVISQPDIVIVSSAGNNMQEDQSKGIDSTFQQLREAVPGARIIATSPYYRAEDFPEDLIEFGDDVRTGVEAIGGEYLDIGHPLAGHPEAMDDDGIHPNDDGHQLIAQAVEQALSN